MVEKKSVIGSLIVTLMLGGAVLITLISGGVQFKIDKYESTFYTLEGEKYVISGMEKNYLYDENHQLLKPLKSTVITKQVDNEIRVTRTVNYTAKKSIVDEYVFLTDSEDVVKFPLTHKVTVLNAPDHYYVYSVSKLSVLPESSIVDGSASFGRKMKVVFNPYYQKADITGNTLRAEYFIVGEKKTFDNRLFDPPPTPTSVTMYYPFDGGVSNSTQANDTSGNNYHAPVTGAVLILE